MKDTNQVTIVGRLARSMTLTYNKNNTAVGRFPLASTTSRKTADGWQDVSNFFDVTVYGSTAQNLSEYLRQGKQVCITGELHQDRWEDKQGNKFYSVYILANNIQLLGGNKNNANNAQQQNEKPAPLQNSQAYTENPPMTQQDYDEMQNEKEAEKFANSQENSGDVPENQELIW